jgi:glycosyltransferase involved in cell wall biosynthesis
MASVVFRDSSTQYDGTSLEQKPLGGTESSVVRLAQALARRGHDVTVYSKCQREIVHQGVRWRPLAEPPPERCDLYVAVVHPALLGFVRKPRRRALWSIWPTNQLKHYKRLPLMWRYRPVPVLCSLHQVRLYSPLLPRRNPHIVIPLALPDDIRGREPREDMPPPEAIFASNPVRNLKGLVEIWAEHIWPRRREAILSVYGIHDLRPGEDPWKVWGGKVLPEGLPPEVRASVRIHPPATREALIEAMRRARVMLYLGHKSEAFCLSLAEAQALGLPAVIAPVAVLPERVIDGVTGFIRADAREFADAALALLSDDALWRRQHAASLRYQQGLSWSDFAARFENAVMGDWIATNRSEAAPLDRVPPLDLTQSARREGACAPPP